MLVHAHSDTAVRDSYERPLKKLDASAMVALATAGLLAATRLPGWRLLALACAGVYAYLAVVAIAQPTQPGSWGVPGGIAAGVVAALFIAATYAHRSPTAMPPCGRNDR
jgi:hypothetical protein